MEIRDRVVELRRIRAKDLTPNPKNWRRHPEVQAAALRGLLTRSVWRMHSWPASFRTDVCS